MPDRAGVSEFLPQRPPPAVKCRCSGIRPVGACVLVLEACSPDIPKPLRLWFVFPLISQPVLILLAIESRPSSELVERSNNPPRWFVLFSDSPPPVGSCASLPTSSSISAQLALSPGWLEPMVVLCCAYSRSSICFVCLATVSICACRIPILLSMLA